MRRTSSLLVQYPLETQVNMEDAATLEKLPKAECPDIWRRLPRHKWPTALSNITEPVVLLERNLRLAPCLSALLCVPFLFFPDVMSVLC